MRTITFLLRSRVGNARAQSARILRERVLVIYLYLPLAVQLCAVSIDYECEKGKAYTYVEVIMMRAESEEVKEE